MSSNNDPPKPNDPFGAQAFPAPNAPAQPGSPPAGWPQAAPWQGPKVQQDGPAPWPAAPQPYGSPPLQPLPPHAVKNIGLFGAVPCPYCGSPTQTSSGSGGAGAGAAGGIVGALLYHAFAAKHYCAQHGEIRRDAFPPQHKSMIIVRKLALVLSAITVLVGVIVLLAIFNS